MNTTTYLIIFLFDMVLVLAEFEDYNDSQNIIGKLFKTFTSKGETIEGDNLIPSFQVDEGFLLSPSDKTEGEEFTEFVLLEKTLFPEAEVAGDRSDLDPDGDQFPEITTSDYQVNTNWTVSGTSIYPDQALGAVVQLRHLEDTTAVPTETNNPLRGLMVREGRKLRKSKSSRLKMMSYQCPASMVCVTEEKCGRNGFIKEVETSPQRSGGRGMLMRCKAVEDKKLVGGFCCRI